MSIDRGDFGTVSQQDLHELVAAQVPEGLRVEYKLDMYGNSGSEKRGFLKDISALANTQGGHLILGIRESSGVAAEIVGLKDIDVDAQLLRLEQIARGGLEPRISGLRIRAIPLSDGRHAILVRVPRSWNPPHRVVAQGSNRFYVRHSAGVHEPDVEELRTLFTGSTLALDHARRFRTERVEAIRAGIGERPLVNEGRLVLHIASVASFSGAVTIDVEQVFQQHISFRPMGSTGMTPRFNYLGFINQRGGDQNYGYTQIFRNGVLEATKASLVRERDGRRFIPGRTLEQHFFEAFSHYVVGLKNIGVPPPLVFMLTLEGVLGVNYVVTRHISGDYEPPLPENILVLPECVLEDYGEDIDHHRAVRPAFDALWNALGYSSSQFFNDDGLWVGEVGGA